MRSASSVAPAGDLKVGLSALLCAQGRRQSGGITWASRGSREGQTRGARASSAIFLPSFCKSAQSLYGDGLFCL